MNYKTLLDHRNLKPYAFNLRWMLAIYIFLWLKQSMINQRILSFLSIISNKRRIYPISSEDVDKFLACMLSTPNYHKWWE